MEPRQALLYDTETALRLVDGEVRAITDLATGSGCNADSELQDLTPTIVRALAAVEARLLHLTEVLDAARPGPHDVSASMMSRSQRVH